jgi:transposase
MEKYILKSAASDQRPKAGEVVHIGIDQGLNKWVYAIRWGGEQRQTFAGPSELTHLQGLVKRFAGNEVRIVHEACGFGYGISRWAQEYKDQVVRVTVVPPSTIEQKPGRRVKTDRIDARKLAHKLEQGELKSVWVPSVEQELARQIERTQQQVAKERRRAQTQVRSMLKAHGYKAPPEAKSWTGYERWLKQLQLPEALQQCVGHLLAVRKQAGHSEQELLRRLRQMSDGEPYAKVVKVWTKELSGIGWLSAIRILLELGEVKRFARRGSLPHYLGLTPSEYSTGDNVNRGPVLRCGPARVRRCLIENAWIAVRRDPQVRVRFNRIAGPTPTSNQKKIAIVAVAHRLAMQLRALWKQAEGDSQPAT